MANSPNELLTGLLKDVSRSFYLTLRVLPRKIRPQIGVAYLLARTSDTIADTEILPLSERLTALRNFRQRLLGETIPLGLSKLAEKQSSPAERILLERYKESLSIYFDLHPFDRKLALEVLQTIISGQELDLQRFAPLESTLQRAGQDSLKAGLQQIVALQTDAELDDYTYRVAGCVGEFWTKMCRAHLFPNAELDDVFLLTNGVRFGKGLQLVNILRDLPVDLRKGRCYLPVEKLSAAGLSPADLLSPVNEKKFRPLYNSYLDVAQKHLDAGWDYTNALPRRCVRVRLACAWPILIGVKTLAKLRTANVLDGERRIKVSRVEVKQIIWRTAFCYPFPGAWRKLFERTGSAEKLLR